MPMSKVTPATRRSRPPVLPSPFTPTTTIPTPSSIGLQAASALGEDPARVLKTLMALVDGKPVCVIVPSDQEVSHEEARRRGRAASRRR